MTDKVYDATARKDGRWWLVEVPELDVAGQARNLAEIGDVAREIAALVLDVDEASVRVKVIAQMPDELRQAWAAARAKTAQAAADQIEAAARTREVVSALRNDGYTYQEAAAVLGLSVPRVQQLAR